MKDIKVSVIVPCWNASDTIRQCMDSLIGQTLSDIEIICVDDGSTDDTLQILLTEYGQRENVWIIDQGADLGQAHTVNNGVQHARGRYIAECDADDWCDPRMYERLYKVAEENEFPDAIRCGITEVFGVDLYVQNPMCPEKADLFVWTPYAEIPETYPLLFGRQCSIPSGIYRREFIVNNSLYYREGHNFEDNSLEFKIRATAESYVMIRDCLYFYNRANEKSGSATIRDLYAICEQCAEMLRYNAERNLCLEGYLNAYRYYLYKWNLSRLTKQEDIEAFAARMRHDFQFNPTRAKFFNTQGDWQEYTKIRGY